MNPGANELHRSCCNPINYGILTGFLAAREYKPKTCTVLDFKTNHGLQRGGSVGWMNLKFINA
jgi:hypothetical protein